MSMLEQSREDIKMEEQLKMEKDRAKEREAFKAQMEQEKAKLKAMNQPAVRENSETAESAAEKPVVKVKTITKTQAINLIRTYKVCASFLPKEQRKMRRMSDDLADEYLLQNVSPEEIIHAAVRLFYKMSLEDQAKIIEKDRAEIGKDRDENDIEGFVFG